MLESSLTAITNHNGKTHFCLLSEKELRMGLSRSSTCLDPIWKSSSKNYLMRVPRTFTDLDEDTEISTGTKIRLKLEPVKAGRSGTFNPNEEQTKPVWGPFIEEVWNSNADILRMQSVNELRNNFEMIKVTKSTTIDDSEICRCPKKNLHSKEQISSFPKTPNAKKWRKDFASNFISHYLEVEENVSKPVKKVKEGKVKEGKSKKKLYEQGQRFKSVDGRDAAATLIQSIWKMHVKRTAYLHYRKQKWAAGMIAISWIMNAKLSKIRKQLINTNRSLIDSYRLRMKVSRHLTNQLDSYIKESLFRTNVALKSAKTKLEPKWSN